MGYKNRIIKVLLECCRVLLGLTFVFSGFVKAIDPMGWTIKIEEYLTAFSLSNLAFLSGLAAFNLASFEFMLGICMLCGAYRRYTSFLTLLTMCFMTPLTLYLALFDPVSDCGCFGDALVITNWQTFNKNVVLLAAAIFVYIYNQRMKSFYSYKAYWFVVVYSYTMCTGFSFYNYNHLPIKDFRPYKIGANIPEQMAIPSGAPEDEYRYSFIYEKDGVEKEFSLEDYPANDSSWAFVRDNTVLVKKGYTPPIEAFTIFNMGGEEVTDIILENKTGIYLLIAPDLTKANDSRIDEIGSTYDYAIEQNIPFYCITGSTKEEIEDWADDTGAEYPFLMADKVLLKTIIRSNPGLVLMKNGTILMKWHNNDIPAEEQIGEVTQKYLNGEIVKPEDNRLITTNLLSFAIPLLLVCGYDYLRNRRKKKNE